MWVAALWCASLVAGVAGQTTAWPAWIADGTYYITSGASGNAIAVAGASVAKDANIEQWPLNNAESQQWRLTHVGGGYFSLMNVGSRLALEVDRASRKNNGNIVQWPYNNAANQQWMLRDAGGAGFYAILNRRSGKALDVVPTLGNGANIRQWADLNATNQHWAFTPVPAACTAVVPAQGSCLHTPGCCAAGYRCFSANQWFAQCLTTCTTAGWTCLPLN